jgi:lysophospholipase L1-like esterase
VRIPRLRLPAVATVLVVAACGSAHAASVTVSPSPSASATAPPSPSPSSTTLDVVGLGDSVTSGANCDCDDYVTGFGRLLAKDTGTRVDVTDDGEAGSTSSSLADDLGGGDRDRQSDVAAADVVVVTTGANDLAPALSAWRSDSCPASCYRPRVDQMEADLSRVLDRVHSLGDGRARVLVTTYWNVFADGEVARKSERAGYLTWSDAVTREANAAISRVAASHGATLVDLYTPFKGDGSADPTELLADDGDHPDPDGTAAISRAVLTAYETRP